MFKCVLSKMKYFLSSFELRRQMILLIFSVRFQFNNFNYSITTSRFLRLNLSEMHMRTLWHQTIGRFYYPSIDVGLILRFTRDAEVRFSPVQPKFLRTANWTFGSVQKIPELRTGPLVQVKEVRSAVQSDLNREPNQ